MALKILELTNFSAGIDGVWQRVQQEAVLLSKQGYEVKVFSSNFTKGSNELAKESEFIGKVEIKRFPAKKLGGESYMSFNFKKSALEYRPDIIIAHVYRHKHTSQALKIAKKINAKCFLVTHAPFVDKGLRTPFQEFVVSFYDKFLGFRQLKKFDKILAITKWEIPYLLNLGVNREKIVYSPNGIPEDFFRVKQKKFSYKKILFLGRLAPVKNIEVLIKAFSILNNHKKNIKLELVGQLEEPYGILLKKLIQDLKLPGLIKFTPAIYDLHKKIKKMQEADIFVLPSKREAMPQSLIEAMSLGKIVISSKTQGGLEIIKDKETGFLFDSYNEMDLVDKIEYCLDKSNSKELAGIQKNARKKAGEFNYNKLIAKLVSLF